MTSLPLMRPQIGMKRKARTPPSRPTHRSLPLHTIVLLIIALIPLVYSAPSCLRFADTDSINQMFIDGGPGTKVHLCPSKTYRLSGTIVFTAADQELATFGYPSGSERAVLRVDGKNLATAIQGDCRRCARVTIRNLFIEGNRAKLGRLVDPDLATGLIVLGGEGQTVLNCRIKDPRGFTAIHVREGDKLSCTGATIERNEIGPVGEEYDEAVDGPDPEMSPLGRPLADGVSIACRDSFVRDNIFFDNTDASIVVFCSPGSVISTNTISARSLSAMAGILLVDSTPFDGDYTGTTVKNNIIDASSRAIRVAIGLGASVWSDDTETILKGGSVLANSLKGKYMGFGIAAAGLTDWTVKDNWSEAKHAGKRTDRCFDEPINPDPMALMYNARTIKDSVFQAGFEDHDFAYVVCIDGSDPTSKRPKAKLAGAQAVEAAKPTTSEAAAPVETKLPSTGSEVMDDILIHSTLRMLEAIEDLGRRVDIMAAMTERPKVALAVQGQSKGVIDGDVAIALAALYTRVESLESSQQALLQSALMIRSLIKAMDRDLEAHELWQGDMLAAIQQQFYTYYGHSSKSQKIPTTGKEPSNDDPYGDILRGKAKYQVVDDDDNLAGDVKVVGYGTIASESGRSWEWKKLGLLGAVLVMGGLGFERWLRKGRHVKRSSRSGINSRSGSGGLGS